MKGWKVIRRKDRMSAIDCIHSITYPKGEEVKPIIKGSKLFFFINKQDAQDFSDGYEGLFMTKRMVVPCIAKGVSKPQYVGWLAHNFEAFWKLRSKMDKYRITTAPIGTRLADSITCLE